MYSKNKRMVRLNNLVPGSRVWVGKPADELHDPLTLVNREIIAPTKEEQMKMILLRQDPQKGYVVCNIGAFKSITVRVRNRGYIPVEMKLDFSQHDYKEINIQQVEDPFYD